MSFQRLTLHFNKYVSFIGLYARNSFSIVHPEQLFACARARATSASCHNRADGREAPGRKIHFSILRAGVQLAVPRWKITKKKRRIDRRNRSTSITLYYTTEPSSLRSFSWFFVDWGSLSLPIPLSFTVNTRTDRDSEPRIDERRVRERRREMKRLMGKKERYKETRKRERGSKW